MGGNNFLFAVNKRATVSARLFGSHSNGGAQGGLNYHRRCTTRLIRNHRVALIAPCWADMSLNSISEQFSLHLDRGRLVQATLAVAAGAYEWTLKSILSVPVSAC